MSRTSKNLWLWCAVHIVATLLPWLTKRSGHKTIVGTADESDSYARSSFSLYPG